ncbi:MAG: hypothetical protein AB7V08_14370 [Elusimicrobiales bacterium]
MINRALLTGGGLLVAMLLAALSWQTVRLAGLETRLAVQAKDLAAANGRIALLEVSEKTLLAVRDGLTDQVAACQQANARAEARAADRTVIIRNAKTVPAKTGQVVDDATSRRAAVHLNAPCRD